LGLGVGLGNFILMDRILVNREAVDKYSLSHEIVHLWLGIHTEYLSKGKFFLGESIPEYVNLLFYESWAGENLFENAIREKTELTYSSGNFFTVSYEQVLNQRKGSAKSDGIIYDKGPQFVHEFRKMVGKEKLLKIIRETYSPPNHFVTIQDLENNIKKNGCWAQYLKLFELNL
jgi:aminopeptidase N